MSQRYQVIRTFFSDWGVADTRQFITRLFKTAERERLWKGEHPNDLLYFQEQFYRVIKSVFKIVSYYDYPEDAVLEESDSVLSPAALSSYCARYRTAWECFPRYLGSKEFLNPYRVLEQFTRYQDLYQWKESLRTLVHYALSNNCLDEFGEARGILRTYLIMQKLVEACHLIVVRMAEAESREAGKIETQEELERNEN